MVNACVLMVAINAPLMSCRYRSLTWDVICESKSNVLIVFVPWVLKGCRIYCGPKGFTLSTINSLLDNRHNRDSPKPAAPTLYS